MAEQIRVYGADWCGDTVRTKRHLDRSGVPYEFIDIDSDTGGEKKVIEFNKGKRRIPMVEIGTDGATTLSVPTDEELDRALTS
jgi:mycoredoxin